MANTPIDIVLQDASDPFSGITPDLGPFKVGSNLFAVFVVYPSTISQPAFRLAMMSSTDGGNTWAESDMADAPAIFNSDYPACLSSAAAPDDPNNLYCAYFDSSGDNILIQPFNFTTKLWGSAGSPIAAAWSLNSPPGHAFTAISLFRTTGGHSTLTQYTVFDGVPSTGGGGSDWYLSYDGGSWAANTDLYRTAWPDATFAYLHVFTSSTDPDTGAIGDLYHTPWTAGSAGTPTTVGSFNDVSGPNPANFSYCCSIAFGNIYLAALDGATTVVDILYGPDATAPGTFTVAQIAVPAGTFALPASPPALVFDGTTLHVYHACHLGVAEYDIYDASSIDGTSFSESAVGLFGAPLNASVNWPFTSPPGYFAPPWGLIAIDVTPPGQNGTPAYYLVGVVPPTFVLTCPSSTAQVGSAYSSSFVATGGVPPYAFQVIAGTLPPGLSLNESTGLLSGTPTSAGTYPYTGQVTDSTGAMATANCSITVAPVITPGCPLAVSVLVNVPYSAQIRVIGGSPPYMYQITSGALPTGLSLNSTTGIISGTPTVTGTFAFTVTITDSNSDTGLNDCAIEVLNCQGVN